MIPSFPLPSFPLPNQAEIALAIYRYLPPSYQPPQAGTPPTRTGPATKTPAWTWPPGSAYYTGARPPATASGKARGSKTTRTPRAGAARTLGQQNNAEMRAAEAEAGIAKGAYSWFTNSGYGLKGDRVGFNTGTVPITQQPTVNDVTEGNVDDSSAFPNGAPSKIPLAKWPARAGTVSTGTGGFTFPTYTETPYYAGPHLIQRGANWYYTKDPNPVSYHVTLSGGSETNKLLYGSNESLTYAELVDPALKITKPRKQRTSTGRSKHPRTSHPRTSTGRAGLGHTGTPPQAWVSLPTPFRAVPPAPVPSRPLGHL